jgi:predicted HTH transcriptional regulator
MSIEARSDLFQALARGDADRILGTAESSWLDFKQQPYILMQPDQPLELAKDVSALANSGGGVLVIGIATERRESTAEDVAEHIAERQSHPGHAGG